MAEKKTQSKTTSKDKVSDTSQTQDPSAKPAEPDAGVQDADTVNDLSWRNVPAEERSPNNSQ